MSGPSADQPLDIALEYVRSHAEDLGLKAADLDNLVVTNQYTSQPSGVTHIYMRQTFGGIEVINAELNVNITANGEVINVGSSFVAGLFDAGKNFSMIPALDAGDALTALADNFGWTLNFDTDEHDGEVSGGTGETSGGVSQATVFGGGGVSLDDIPVELHFMPTDDGGIELVWNLVVRAADSDRWFEASVSADDGEMIYLSDWGAHAAEYNVYASPLENPNDGDRTLVVAPADATASPFGWHDTDGVAGAEYTDTRGNNVSAQEDRDANNAGGFRPDGGADLSFDFDIDFTQDPSTYEEAAITNLFYWNNISHDVFYQYGFDEASGNFQVNNYGNGGLGGDAVQADAQDGSGFNNANFYTPPDGLAPRMQQFIFDLTTPNRDSDLSNSIIIHEYGHGVSNRLTGGAANSGALNAIQSGGMGEGWGDWWSLMLTQKTTDLQYDSYVVGDYVLDDPGGVRTRPYSFNMSVNDLTYDNFNFYNQVHFAGEIWASTLWDLNWLLINGDGGDIPAQGFDADLYNGTGGNNIALQLVMDGLKLQPSNPSFLDARDAILAADRVANGGANQLAIWTAFARRGMGYSADDGGSGNATTVVAAFDLPATSTGTVAFDAELYEVGDPVTITVRDSDLMGGGPIDVDLVSSGGDIETVSLAELGAGIFQGTISTAASSTPNDGTLSIAENDILTITYFDADDGTGNPAVLVDTATVIFLTDIFVQDFESGLRSNETLFGGFTINDTNTPLNNGTLMVGHPTDYTDNEYSYYEVSLDLTAFEFVYLEFEYTAWIEGHFDRFNLQASTATISPPNDLIYSDSGLSYTDYGHPHRPELGDIAYDSGWVLDSGVAVFDLSAFDGQVVNVRFQFGSDSFGTYPGINFDNIEVRGVSVETPPVADAGGAYVFGLGRDVTRLDASGTFDVNQSTASLIYEWDYDNDGQFDDARGLRPYFDTTDLNGRASALVRLKVTDSEGMYGGAKTMVYREDPSRLRIMGSTLGVIGQRRSITLDLSPTTNQETYDYTIDWGDGRRLQTISGPAGMRLGTVYHKTGVYTIRVTASNRFTGLHTMDTHRINIGTMQVQGDDFAISGSNANDTFRAITRYGQDRVEIFHNGLSKGVHTVPGRIYAIGFGGNDVFRGDWGSYDVVFDGGSGNNTSYTYGGNDVIYGRGGNDKFYAFAGDNYIHAGHGDNLIYTRTGNDRIYTGNGDDDIIDTGGNNRIFAGNGNNDINTRKGNDYIVTGSGNDEVNDLGGDNWIEVGDGSNVVESGRGNDTLIGGAHDDHFVVGGEFGGFPGVPPATTNYIFSNAGNDYIIAGGYNVINSGTGSDFVLGFNLVNDENDDDLFDLLARVR